MVIKEIRNHCPLTYSRQNKPMQIAEELLGLLSFLLPHYYMIFPGSLSFTTHGAVKIRTGKIRIKLKNYLSIKYYKKN
jgi:hypothetical protein